MESNSERDVPNRQSGNKETVFKTNKPKQNKCQNILSVSIRFI